jgi:hypothetical protein
MTPQDGQTWGPIIGIGIAVIAMTLRARSGKAKAMNFFTLWIVPLMLLTLLTALTYASHLKPLEYLWVVVGLAAGSALGWQRGRMMPIHIDPETGKPMVKTSVAALVFILGLMAVRVLLRGFFEGQANAWHINPVLVSDVFLAFAVGLLGTSRIEMFIRARRLIAEHKSVA